MLSPLPITTHLISSQFENANGHRAVARPVINGLLQCCSKILDWGPSGGKVCLTLTLCFFPSLSPPCPLSPLSIGAAANSASSLLQQWHNLRNKRRKSSSELVHCESSRAILSSWAHFCTLARLPRWAICMVCQADMAEVIFQPCKDKVTCTHCCAKMKRCIKCHANIESKCKEGECWSRSAFSSVSGLREPPLSAD